MLNKTLAAGLLSTLMASLLLCHVSSSALAQQYDLVINNGRVMDPETMFDSVANVGIKDGRIAVITTDKITGKETINATGHVVTAGFLDTHNHAMDPLATRMAVRMGDTGLDAMKVRGRMQRGMVADIVVFDPKTVADKATFKPGENTIRVKSMPAIDDTGAGNAVHLR